MSDDFDVKSLFTEAQTQAAAQAIEASQHAAQEQERRARLERERTAEARRAQLEREAKIDALPKWIRWIAREPSRAALILVFSILLLVCIAMVIRSV